MLNLRIKFLSLILFLVSAFSLNAETVYTYYFDPKTRQQVPVQATILNDDVFANNNNRDWKIIKPGVYLVDRDIEPDSFLYGVDDEMPDARVSLCITDWIDVHLIIADDKELKLPKGLLISEGSSLTISAQSDGENCGKITAGRNIDSDNKEMAGIEPMGTLIINGCNIYATSVKYCAGIGLGKCSENTAKMHKMNITINGGVVEAHGGQEAAGIGGQGHHTNIKMGGEIKITGGTVKAYGGDKAAGIGGGNKGTACKITISGGNVTARAGSDYGAGIGGGNAGGCGEISISGGEVVTYGGDEAPGIGSGDGYKANDVGSIRISGGKVTAYAGSYTSTSGGDGLAPAIGPGDDNEYPIPITISGGTVDAWGARRAASIGGSEDSSAGQIIISGGNVTVHPNRNGFGIAPGQGSTGGSFDTGPNGSAIIRGPIYFTDDRATWWCIHFDPNPVLYAGSSSDPRQFVLTDNLVLSKDQVLSVPINVNLSIGVGVKVLGDNNGAGVLDLTEGGTLSGDVYGAFIASKSDVKRRVRFASDLTRITKTVADGTKDLSDSNFTFTLLPENGYELPYMISVSVADVALADDQYSYNRMTGSVIIDSKEIRGNIKIKAKAFPSGGSGFYEIQPETEILEDDVYIVNNDVTVNRILPVKGSVVIFSRENTTLTVNGGLALDIGASLLIMPYNNGCGKIICKGENKNAGIGVPERAQLVIQDGNIEAEGDDLAAGIGGVAYRKMGKIKIYGGNIKATGGEHGAGIGSGRESACGTILIQPEKEVVVNAVGGIWATGIGGGYRGDGGEIIIEGGHITAKTTSVSDDSPGIGAGKEAKNGTFSTGSMGSPFIRTTTMKVDRSNQDEWSGIIFEESGLGGCVYKNQVVDYDLELKRSDWLLVPKGTTLEIKSPHKLKGSGGLDLSEGGYFIGSIAKDVKLYISDYAYMFDSQETASLSSFSEEVLARIVKTTVSVNRIDVYKTDSPGSKVQNPIETLNKAIERYENYFDEYLYDATTSSEKASGIKSLRLNKPKFTIEGFGVNSEVANFVVSLEGAKFKPGVSAKVWMSTTPRFSIENNSLTEYTKKDFKNGEVEQVSRPTVFPAIDFVLSEDRTKATFYVVKPSEMRFFKVVIDPVKKNVKL